jgi:hypothetical protein
MTQWSYRHYVDHANQLASARSNCWCDAQLAILDHLIESLADMYQEDNPTNFDRMWWCDKARLGFDRLHTTTGRDNQHRRQT